MCCVVFERERTTTGTPTSMLRKIFRQRSKKFVKLLTQPTKAAARPMTSLPSPSSSRRASFSRRSTSRACCDSSISVMPSCLWKSRAWYATSSAASGPLKNTSSIARTGPRRSALATRKPCTCSMTLSTLLAAARTWLPFLCPKASTVSTRWSPCSTSPRSSVVIGASCQALGSKASNVLRTSARSFSVSTGSGAVRQAR
mmetsp:Transcript_71242/g.201932  ORF Transcript_71242/g.201932 Transcript_71242/m.201932 type:complete len:200 (-) Transcript_71242:28-627(-)